jgi:hypothetical protein
MTVVIRQTLRHRRHKIFTDNIDDFQVLREDSCCSNKASLVAPFDTRQDEFQLLVSALTTVKLISYHKVNSVTRLVRPNFEIRIG